MSELETKHKVFLSYYHKDDEFYKNKFEELFEDLFISKSVKPDDIDVDVSTEYIKRLIQEEYITNASVLVVLVGQKTHCRKHVDWEISAALNEKVGEYSGLLGLRLPTRPNYQKDEYTSDIVPPRLVDNLESGYAKFYHWTEDKNLIKERVEIAFQARISEADKIDNSRKQFDNNRCE